MKYFALFGGVVSHSKSPILHNKAFKELKYDACYTRHLLENGSELKETFFDLKLSGINVTVPYKRTAANACDVLDPFAKTIGVVNTILEKDGLLYGYNTDGPAFLKSISEFNAKTVLFIGAGGTAKSTSSILRNAGYDVTILNRTKERLDEYKRDDFKAATYETFVPKAYDLIVNMTSAGLVDEELPAPKELLDILLPLSTACVDVIYDKETPFLKLAKSHNRPTKDGSDMLFYQAVYACIHFTDGKFSFDEIEQEMRKASLL